MHSKEDDIGSLKEERIPKDTEESGPNVFDGSNEIKRYLCVCIAVYVSNFRICP